MKICKPTGMDPIPLYSGVKQQPWKRKGEITTVSRRELYHKEALGGTEVPLINYAQMLKKTMGSKMTMTTRAYIVITL